jgi:ribonuclease T1
MWRNRWGAWGRIAAVTLLTLSGAWAGGVAQAKTPVPAALQTVVRAELPAQAQAMMTLIEQGGPFKYDKDGTVFGNREKILPARQRGYYREYTVKTPGERSRGARRIVCGGQQPRAPDACFYTDDHYGSFRQIVR